MKRSYMIEIEINEVTTSLNKTLRQNKYSRNTKNKAWYDLIFWRVRDQLPPVPLKKAKLTFVRHYWQMLDYDNLTASFKPIADGLVRAGIISDDRWGVTGKWNINQKFRPRKDGPLTYIKVEGIYEPSIA